MSGARPGTRLLGIEDVASLLGLEKAIELQREAFVAKARGSTTEPPSSLLHLPPERGGWLKLLNAYDGASRGLAVKVLARFPEREPGRNLGSLLLLFDDETGAPLAVMDSVYVTAVRTVAAGALASTALARPNPSRLGLIGTGVLAWHALRAYRHAFPKLRSVVIFSRSAARREALAERARAELGFEASAAGSAAQAAAGADVVITATNAPEAVLRGADIEPGQHLDAIGVATELDPAATAGARVIPDSRDVSLRQGKFSLALAAGAATEDELGPELGEVLDGSAPGRRGEEEITLFDSTGIAIQDVVCARYLWEEAERRELGTRFDFSGASVLA